VLIEQEPVGGGESNAESYRELEEGGVDVRWAPGAFKHNHEKSLVIDDQLAMIATFNFTNSSFTHNREYAVVTDEPDVVADVAAIFDADWAGEGVKISKDSPLVVSPVNSRQRITGLIEDARESLWLEEATLLDEDITLALVDAAKRGVAVRFLAPQRNDNDVAAENLQRLVDAGAQVARLDEPYIHAKVILADDERAFIGSENLTFTSLELNRELGVITEEESVIARLRKTMARDWEIAGGGASENEQRATPPGVISWQDAEQYVGQEVTVQGQVVHTYDSGKVTFLNFDEDYRNTLTIVLFPSIYDQFPEKPAVYFDGRLIQVSGPVKMYEGKPEIVVSDPAQIQVLDDTASAAPAAVPSSPTPAPAPAADAPVPWQDAGDYVGQKVTVAGEVVRSYNSGKVVFLNFDEDWRGKFSVVIFASDFDNFPQPPEEMYLHKAIHATGKIKEYKGAPEMIVESPEQIEIVDANPAEASSQSNASEPPKGVVSWRDAGDYVGQEATVEGRIIRTKDIGSITFLNFGKDRDDFVAVVRAKDYDNFPDAPAQLYHGKKVWITGEISLHKGVPQMVLHSPAQIEVFD
jgi:DNA/RNA endonuclease YhcR with UshA esterase domain/HKD family nuclease